MSIPKPSQQALSRHTGMVVWKYRYSHRNYETLLKRPNWKTSPVQKLSPKTTYILMRISTVGKLLRSCRRLTHSDATCNAWRHTRPVVDSFTRMVRTITNNTNYFNSYNTKLGDVDSILNAEFDAVFSFSIAHVEILRNLLFYSRRIDVVRYCET
jgi:hypothetical protein